MSNCKTKCMNFVPYPGSLLAWMEDHKHALRNEEAVEKLIFDQAKTIKELRDTVAWFSKQNGALCLEIKKLQDAVEVKQETIDQLKAMAVKRCDCGMELPLLKPGYFHRCFCGQGWMRDGTKGVTKI